MKFGANLYAKALAQAVKGATGLSKEDMDAMAKRVAEMVEKNGDTAEFSKIVEAAEKLIREQNGDRKITLTSARPLGDAAKALLASIAKPGDTVEQAIDPSLLAGLKVLIDDETQFDGSLKAKLEKMFGN